MKFFSIVMILAAGLLLASCAASPMQTTAPANSPTAAVLPTPDATAAQAQARLITPEEAKQRLASEQGIVLLDVREPDEYAEGHIAGSVLLPLGDITAKVEVTVPDKDTVVFVYCRSGRRSALAADELVKLGYTQVFDLGGIIDWPYGVEK